MANFYIIRHGETEWNVLHKLQGHVDIPLNDNGRSQAANVGSRLAHIEFHVTYASDLKRAAETAHIIAGSPPKLDQRLRERNMGPWEGVDRSTLKDGKAWQLPDIETDAAMEKRTLSFLDEMCALHLGSNILVVTHGGLMRNLYLSLSDLPRTSDIEIENGGLLHLAYDNGYQLIHTHGIKILS